jgi:hypothetical protein
MGRRWARLPYRTRIFEHDQRFSCVTIHGGAEMCRKWWVSSRWSRRTCGSCQDRTEYTALPGRSGAREPRLLSQLRRTETERVRPWITASEGRCGDGSVCRARRPLLPGVMSLRARWRRRRARAHLMNELLAAMDTPSRLDREDRVSAPRPVTRCTGSVDGAPDGQPRMNVRSSGDTDPTRGCVISTVTATNYTGNR